VDILEYVLCAFFLLLLVSIFAALLIAQVLRWCGRHDDYDDQLSVNWKPEGPCSTTSSTASDKRRLPL